MTASDLPSVFVIGDSISIQYGPFLEQGLNGLADYDRLGGEAEALADLDVPAGANGGDSGRVLKYLTALCQEESFRPDVLLINCGLHDIKVHGEQSEDCQVDLATYGANLHAVVDQAANIEAALIWVRTTPLNERIHNQPGRAFSRYERDHEAYDEVALAVMAERGIPVIDLRTFTEPYGDEAFCDHVHFTDSVRQAQGAFIAGWLACGLVGSGTGE